MIASERRCLPVYAMLAGALVFASGAAPCASLGDDLIGSWRVTVTGEPRARTLRVIRVEAPVHGEARVFAVYGWYGEELSAVRVMLSEEEGRQRLSFTSQLGSQIDVAASDDGGFQGRFRTPTGQVKPMQIRRMAPGEDTSAVAAQFYVVKPGPDVPPECARFSGLWEGEWSFFQGGKTWIWVLEVDARCQARIVSQSALVRPRAFSVVDISGGVGVLQVPNGSLSLKVVGDELRLNWNSGIYAINNGARLRRVEDPLP